MPWSALKRVKISESQVIDVWQRQLLSGAKLVTETGESIRIVYPGRINDGRGADFRDAVIATGSGLVKGDIEVHVKSSGWLAHRHHQDTAYNRVILHVVMWHDSKSATSLQNGKGVPTLVLHKYLGGRVGQRSGGARLPVKLSMPCLKAIGRLPSSVVAAILDKAGEERFFSKVAEFQADLARVGASQCLYRGIMGALGYSKNKFPFLELARRLPLQVLESVTRGAVSDKEYLAWQQALLLGTAGLLPSQYLSLCPETESGDEWTDRLEGLWSSSGYTGVMSRDDWQLFKVRPSNLPVRRMIAMSYLLLRYREEGVVVGMVELVKAASLCQAYARLENGLIINTGGYRASHFDFGGGIKIRNQTLLGSRRAADIAVNVILPFIVAWGQFTSQPELVEKSLNLYHYYPGLAENSVERHMRRQLRLSSSLVNSARRRQGLIHIYRTLCTQGRCDCCPLSQFDD